MPLCVRTLVGLAVFCILVPTARIDAQTQTPTPPAVENQAPKGLLLEDPPAFFVPAHPQTVDEKKNIELAELYAAARAHESRREWTEALEILEKCLKLDGENVAVLKRMSRLNLALGRMEPGVNYAKKALALEPDNSLTLRLVISYYERRNQFNLAEKLLDETVANPKLPPKSATALYAHFARGLLYAGRLQQPEKAGDELIKVMDLLDDKEIAEDPSGETARILGGNPANLYMNFGRIFAAIKRWNEAARAFERGASYNPDDTVMPVLLVSSLMELNKPAEALQKLDLYLKREPSNREPYELLSRLLTVLKKPDDITPRLEELLKQSPNNPGLIGVLADRYRDSGENEKAKPLYDKLVQIQPDPQGFGALAAGLIKDKKYDGFLDLMARALIRPGGLESIRPQLDSLAVNAAEATAVLDVAIKRLNADPKAYQRPMYNSLFYLARNADLLNQLITLRSLAAKADPTPDTMRELALTYYENGQYAEAAKVMKELIEKFPNEADRRTILALVQFQLQGKLIDEASSTIDSILKKDPNDPSSLRMKCFILSDQKKYDQAITIGKGILKKAPEDVDFNRLVGGIMLKAERYDEAIAFYRELLSQYPANNELARIAHSGLSVIYVNIDDFTSGEKELETLLKRIPDDIEVFNDLGYLYADQGKRLEEAEEMIRKAVTEEPENSAYLDSLGWVLYKRGKYVEALKYLEKAIQIARRNGPDGTLFDHLGDVLFRMKQFDKAREAWLEAQKHIEDNKMGQKLASTIKAKLENLDRLPRQVSSDSSKNP